MALLIEKYVTELPLGNCSGNPFLRRGFQAVRLHVSPPAAAYIGTGHEYSTDTVL